MAFVPLLADFAVALGIGLLIGLRREQSGTGILAAGSRFALVLLATRWLGSSFGDSGVYGAALLSGVVDVDAVTRALARLSAEGGIPEHVAATGILLVAPSNFAFKIGIILVVGTRRLAGGAALPLLAAPVVAIAVGLAWGL